MAKPGQFHSFRKPKSLKSKSKIRSKPPAHIYRCKQADGSIVLAERYDFVSRRRAAEWEIKPCTLDSSMPAAHIVTRTCTLNSRGVHKPVATHVDINPTYELEMLQWGLQTQDMNEYDLRVLCMNLVKSKMKKVPKPVLVKACGLFDKADKMLNRADLRKNSNINEAAVSYRFMCKNYSKILDILEKKP